MQRTFKEDFLIKEDFLEKILSARQIRAGLSVAFVLPFAVSQSCQMPALDGSLLNASRVRLGLGTRRTGSMLARFLFGCLCRLLHVMALPPQHVQECLTALQNLTIGRLHVTDCAGC